MSPGLSQTFGFSERQESSSILATGLDDYDWAEDWIEPNKSLPSRWQILYPDKTSFAPSSQWKSRLTSLSSSVIGAGTVFAKHLNVGESTRRAISQLRNAIDAVSSSPEASPRSPIEIQHQISEADIDYLGDMVDQPEREIADDESMDVKAGKTRKS
ncbi:uncharacterized protein PHALS_07868 [Plasmopara halstedii]|uniref:Uncharacterized protein n=1 Tax=Plasmopara halstedii TaxID=4781 RepID=A0A0P1B8B3_PLAHL|nr:uncharacterized protein PHALS_07868 [Plasmopara halstedii]CEG50143.1 hypothetical protein PHALS_07868 [Plasmopara halstedii]|eukprot:XP_024586512.1 hypothetical protein PHALS_07868 [Plasmopara halstedii]